MSHSVVSHALECLFVVLGQDNLLREKGMRKVTKVGEKFLKTNVYLCCCFFKQEQGVKKEATNENKQLENDK